MYNVKKKHSFNVMFRAARGPPVADQISSKPCVDRGLVNKFVILITGLSLKKKNIQCARGLATLKKERPPPVPTLTKACPFFLWVFFLIFVAL